MYVRPRASIFGYAATGIIICPFNAMHQFSAYSQSCVGALEFTFDLFHRAVQWSIFGAEQKLVTYAITVPSFLAVGSYTPPHFHPPTRLALQKYFVKWNFTHAVLKIAIGWLYIIINMWPWKYSGDKNFTRFSHESRGNFWLYHACHWCQLNNYPWQAEWL